MKSPRKERIVDLSPQKEGSQVNIRGWIYTKRLHGQLIFLTLRDATGVIQVTIHKNQIDTTQFDQARKVNIEAAVQVSGQVKVDPRAPGDVEIQCQSFEVIGDAFDDYPLQKDAGTEFLLDKRHLHIRSPAIAATFRLRALFIQSARSWLNQHNFSEVHCPILITAACEGGSTLFPVDYFQRQAYLSQSVQLYQEAAITSLEKVYSIEPSFRAEKSRTRRHLTEFWQIEAEAAHASLEDIMNIQEALLVHVCQAVVTDGTPEFAILQKTFSPPTSPFMRITYSTAVETLRGLDYKFNWGDDFGAVEERVLSHQYRQPVFITHFPRQCKAFYHDPDPTNPEVTLSADLLAPQGFGEIAGGGQRISDYHTLIQSLQQFNLPASDYDWYLDLRRYGGVMHSGFGMGIERVLRWILQLSHIREACLFPRTPARVYP
jgi:asparaginyl-tRNA synthetase